MQMDFDGKIYGAKTQFNFVNNGKVDDTSNHVDRTKAFMEVSCEVIFVQVEDLTNPNRHNQMTTKAVIGKF